MPKRTSEDDVREELSRKRKMAHEAVDEAFDLPREWGKSLVEITFEDGVPKAVVTTHVKSRR